MTLKELRDALLNVCSSVAYAAFETGVDPPFICYRGTGNNDFLADDENYQPIGTFDIELYTNGKEPGLESDLEAALKDLELVWDKTEAYVKAEKLVEVVYSVSILPSESDDSSA